MENDIDGYILVTFNYVFVIFSGWHVGNETKTINNNINKLTIWMEIIR